MNKFTRYFTFIALSFLLVAMSSSISAQSPPVFYVATNGNDANPGTEAQPFRTLTRGVKSLTPGAMLMVKEGKYEEELRNNIPSGTSWQSPVTLKAYPGQTVLIMPKAGAERVLTFSGDKHFIIIDGFILDGTNVRYECIKIAGVSDATKPSPSHIRLINNEIRNAGLTKKSNGEYKYFGAGILTSGNSNYVEYINNVIHNNGLTDYDHGIYHTSSYGLIEGNVIYANKGTGIKVGWGQNAVDNIVRNNIVYDNNAAQGQDGRKKQGRGIGVYAGSGTLVYNNIIWGAHALGIDVTYDGNNAKIYNNTIYSTMGYGIGIGFGSSGGTATNTIVRNNIVYQQATTPAIYDPRGVNTIIENNMTFGQNPKIDVFARDGNVTRNNLVGIDPHFMDLTNKNFALTAQSPAIDAGVSLGDVLIDFTDTVRPQGLGYDIGAFEFALPAQTYTDPTVYLTAQFGSTQPGGELSMTMNVTNLVNLYGLQAQCTADPRVLVGHGYKDGVVFNKDNSFIVDQGYNAADGRWTLAASLISPNAPFSGDAAAFTLNYTIQNAGSSPVNCAVIAVDENGREIPVQIINMLVNTNGSVQNQDPATPPISDIPDDPAVPHDDPVIVVVGTIMGTAAYQSRATDSNIMIELLANDQRINQVALDANGAFSFTDMSPQTYVVKVTAPHHLSVARLITVESSGQPLQLETIVLPSGDVDSNLAVDIVDASLVGANFGLEANLFPDADLNGDGTINVADLVLVGSNFGLSGVLEG